MRPSAAGLTTANRRIVPRFTMLWCTVGSRVFSLAITREHDAAI